MISHPLLVCDCCGSPTHHDLVGSDPHESDPPTKVLYWDHHWKCSGCRTVRVYGCESTKRHGREVN